MHGATHFATGLAAGAGVAVITGETRPGTVALAIIIGGVAGLIPDWIQINIPGASNQLKGTFGHRGFSHWLWTPLIITLVVSTNAPHAPGWALWAFVAGWGSHILLDALAGGAPAFWPFGRVTLARIKTGGKIDKLTGGAALVVCAILAITALV